MLKLHLGCGGKIFNNWINIDNYENPNVFKHDLRLQLPFEKNTVSYVYSEHFFEHLDELDGYNLLSNIYDLLKKDGVLRISMPCLDEVLHTYNNWHFKKNSNDYFKRFDNQDQFLNFAFFGESSSQEKIKFLNNAISTNDGHKYLYSKKDIFFKLNKLGFIKAYECKKNESIYQELKNLESRQQICDMTFEAIK